MPGCSCRRRKSTPRALRRCSSRIASRPKNSRILSLWRLRRSPASAGGRSKAAPSDDVSAAAKLSDAPATPAAAPRDDLLVNVDPADMGSNGRPSEAALVPETSRARHQAADCTGGAIAGEHSRFQGAEGSQNYRAGNNERKIETERKVVRRPAGRPRVAEMP